MSVPTERKPPEDRQMPGPQPGDLRGRFLGLSRTYAPYLFDYAQELLGERAAAAEAIAYVLGTAVDQFDGAQIDAAHADGSLRPWLYAAVRGECAATLADRDLDAPDGSRSQASRSQASRTSRDDASPATGSSAEQGIAEQGIAEQGIAEREVAEREVVDDAMTAEYLIPELEAEEHRRDVAVVTQVLGCLDPSEVELLSLAIRHGFDDEGMAAVLRITEHRVDSDLSEVIARFDQLAVAVVLLHAGWSGCKKLDRLVGGSYPSLPSSERMARKIARHGKSCSICGQIITNHGFGPELLSVLPVPDLPPAVNRWLRTVAPPPDADAPAEPPPDPADLDQDDADLAASLAVASRAARPRRPGPGRRDPSGSDASGSDASGSGSSGSGSSSSGSSGSGSLAAASLAAGSSAAGSLAPPDSGPDAPKPAAGPPVPPVPPLPVPGGSRGAGPATVASPSGSRIADLAPAGPPPSFGSPGGAGPAGPPTSGSRPAGPPTIVSPSGPRVAGPRMTGARPVGPPTSGSRPAGPPTIVSPSGPRVAGPPTTGSSRTASGTKAAGVTAATAALSAAASAKTGSGPPSGGPGGSDSDDIVSAGSEQEAWLTRPRAAVLSALAVVIIAMGALVVGKVLSASGSDPDRSASVTTTHSPGSQPSGTAPSSNQPDGLTRTNSSHSASPGIVPIAPASTMPVVTPRPFKPTVEPSAPRPTASSAKPTPKPTSPTPTPTSSSPKPQPSSTPPTPTPTPTSTGP